MISELMIINPNIFSKQNTKKNILIGKINPRDVFQFNFLSACLRVEVMERSKKRPINKLISIGLSIFPNGTIESVYMIPSICLPGILNKIFMNLTSSPTSRKEIPMFNRSITGSRFHTSSCFTEFGNPILSTGLKSHQSDGIGS